ncbi:MAG TPA: DUF2142 domain-containing protein [Planctomycetota bacterium]
MKDDVMFPEGRPARRGLASLPLERLYLWLAVPAGLLFVFLNPPFAGVPDELAHYLRALALAQGELGRRAEAPKDYVDLVGSVRAEDERQRWGGLDPEGVRRALTVRPGPELAQFHCRIGYAYPFAFLPQALVLKLGLEARAPPLVTFLLARLVTLLLATWLVHAAIRVAPTGKLVFALVALLPEAFQQMASVSYDALHFGVLLYFSAHVLALAHGTRSATRRELGLAVLLSLGGTLLKPGYTAMALLVLLVPRRHFRGPRAHGAFVLGTLALNGAALALGLFWFGMGIPVEDGQREAQMALVTGSPLAFLGVVVNTLYLGLQGLWEGLVFRSGQSSSTLAPLTYVLVGCACVVLLRSQDELTRPTPAQRAVLLGTVLIQTVLIHVPLFLLTPVGRPVVLGLQGRYFMVLVPPLVLGLAGLSLRSEWVRRHLRAALIVFAVVLLACAMVHVLRLH